MHDRSARKLLDVTKKGGKRGWINCKGAAAQRGPGCSDLCRQSAVLTTGGVHGTAKGGHVLPKVEEGEGREGCKAPPK